MSGINNFERYFDSPAKLASCIIEHDVDAATITDAESPIRVFIFDENKMELLGEFENSWEFEEWMYTDLPFEIWRNNRS